MACAGDIRLARRAGRMPPTSPMTAAKATPCAKVISLKAIHFVAPVVKAANAEPTAMTTAMTLRRLYLA